MLNISDCTQLILPPLHIPLTLTFYVFVYICRLKNSLIAAGTAIAGGPENPPQAYGPPQGGPRRPTGPPQYGSQAPGGQQVRLTHSHTQTHLICLQFQSFKCTTASLSLSYTRVVLVSIPVAQLFHTPLRRKADPESLVSSRTCSQGMRSNLPNHLPMAVDLNLLQGMVDTLALVMTYMLESGGPSRKDTDRLPLQAVGTDFTANLIHSIA